MKKGLSIRLSITLAAALFTAACEVEVGDADASNNNSGSSPQAPVNTGNNTAGNNTGTGNNTGNNNNNNNNNGQTAPAAPTALSPGNGEHFAGSGAKVTFVWTDAEGAAQFEVLVQAMGTGGWQGVANPVTDNFQASYTLNNAAWTQYRWAVRSLGSDSQASAWTAWRSFTWSP